MNAEKMSQFEAPIARGEDFADFGDFQTSATGPDTSSPANDSDTNSNGKVILQGEDDLADSNFGDVFSGSLEDLVNTFDQKIIRCFRDYDEEVETFAPVQVLSQEEILNQSPSVFNTRPLVVMITMMPSGQTT